MSEPSLKKNFALSTVYQVLLLIVPFITAPYVSRVLTADGIGIYSFTNSIQMYFAMFAALGTVSYGSREIARNRNDKEKRSKLFWEIELLTVVTSGVCLILYGLFIAVTKEYQVYFLILAFNIVAVMLDISWFYRGLEQFQFTVGPNAFFKIIGVISIFIFVKTEHDLALYILIMTLVTLLGNITMWFYLPRFIARIDFRKIKIKKHYKETLVYFVPTIASSVYTILDKTLIGLITADTSENGYYEQATKIVNMAKSLTFTSLNSLMSVRISFLFAENRKEEVKERIADSIDFIMFMGIGICIGMISVAPRFVPVFFGEGYEPVVQLLYLLSPIIIIIGVSNCLGDQYYNPVGLRSLSAKFIIIGSCINLVLNLILIPTLRSIGAVLATIAAESVITFLYLRYCNGYLTFKVIINKAWKKMVSGVAMFLGILLIGSQIQNDIIATCVEVVAGITIYCVFLFMLRDSFIERCIRILTNKFRK